MSNRPLLILLLPHPLLLVKSTWKPKAHFNWFYRADLIRSKGSQTLSSALDPLRGWRRLYPDIFTFHGCAWLTKVKLNPMNWVQYVVVESGIHFTRLYMNQDSTQSVKCKEAVFLCVGNNCLSYHRAHRAVPVCTPCLWSA